HTFYSSLSEEPRTGLQPLNTNSERKYRSSSPRLSNNSISDLAELQNILSHLLAEPLKLIWLDLSFDKLTHTDPVRFLVIHINFSLSFLQIHLENTGLMCRKDTQKNSVVKDKVYLIRLRLPL
uniref:Uncharacterized protein n=1 Tax=Sphaeramia orbicularis TaxID=375764 RepID=A0A673BGU2_9TELE